MIALDDFNAIAERLRADPDPLNGWPLQAHIDWSENASPPASPEEFAIEAIFVICNSGMHHAVARKIFHRLERAILSGEPTNTEARAKLGLQRIFGHDRKTRAIDRIWADRRSYFDGFMIAADKVEYCGTMPHIGPITRSHLAKNFGADVAKPDVHLQRLADHHGTSPQQLCNHLASLTGLKARTIDLVLWMACARGVIDSRTGAHR